MKEEYEGSEKIKGIQVLNLILKFEMQRMIESEAIKVYVYNLLTLANKVNLLNFDFLDSRIVQKVLIIIPKNFKAIITSLEKSRDFSSITFIELLNAFLAREQRRLMREEASIEGALLVKSQNNEHKN